MEGGGKDARTHTERCALNSDGSLKLEKKKKYSGFTLCPVIKNLGTKAETFPNRDAVNTCTQQKQRN